MNADELKIFRTVFDVATTSMDFGSGFLDEPEVQALRAAAEMLGIDPMIGTPYNHVCQVTGEHEFQAEVRNIRNPDGSCVVEYRDDGHRMFPTEPNGFERCWRCGLVRDCATHSIVVRGTA